MSIWKGDNNVQFYNNLMEKKTFNNFKKENTKQTNKKKTENINSPMVLYSWEYLVCRRFFYPSVTEQKQELGN